VLAILDEAVDGHNGQVRIRLGVVNQVQVNELLDLHVVCSLRESRGGSGGTLSPGEGGGSLRLTGAHAVDDVGEERVHVLAHRDGRDDLLDGVLHDVNVRVGQLRAQLAHLALLVVAPEEAAVLAHALGKVAARLAGGRGAGGRAPG